MKNREIDTLVAEKVMGWKVSDELVFFDENGLLLPDFRPSQDISDAWRVVKKMGDNEFFDKWFTYFANYHYMHEITPEEICLAALEAVWIEIEEDKGNERD